MSDTFSVRAEQHIVKALGQMNVASLDQVPPDVRRRLMREAREMTSQDVYGVDHKKDAKGQPIEQGVGSANNMSRQAIAAYIAEQTTRRPGGPEPGYEIALAKMEQQFAECQARRKAEQAKEDDF
jgi:hypothetical protein